MVERQPRGDAALEQLVDEPAVEVEPPLLDGARAQRLHPRPGDREAVGAQAQLAHERDVLPVAGVVVAGDVAGVAVQHPPRRVAEDVPDRRPPAVRVGAALDLVRRGRRAPGEPGRERRCDGRQVGSGHGGESSCGPARCRARRLGDSAASLLRGPAGWTSATPGRRSAMTSPTPAAPTLEEVARRAGVSRATVSRVINDSPKVSPEAREAVLEAVAELQYVPNQMARSLVRRRTDTLALVLSEPETRLFSDPFFASIVRGVSAALADTERNLVLLTARDRREQEKVGRYVMQGHVDGVIFMSLHRRGRPARAPAPQRHPRGALGAAARRPAGGLRRRRQRRAAGAPRPSCCSDTGRRAVGSVTGPADMVAGIDRHAGYRAALEAAGLPVRDDLVEAGDFTEQGGRRATEALLARAPGPRRAVRRVRPDGRRGAGRPARRRPAGAGGRRRRRLRRRRGGARLRPAADDGRAAAARDGAPHDRAARRAHRGHGRRRTSTTWSRRRSSGARARERRGRSVPAAREGARGRAHHRAEEPP